MDWPPRFASDRPEPGPDSSPRPVGGAVLVSDASQDDVAAGFGAWGRGGGGPDGWGAVGRGASGTRRPGRGAEPASETGAAGGREGGRRDASGGRGSPGAGEIRGGAAVRKRGRRRGKREFFRRHQRRGARCARHGVRAACDGGNPAFGFNGKDVFEADIAHPLGVPSGVNGSVQQGGGTQLRMRVRLTNAAGGFLMWSEMFREELEDVFGGRDRIARQIAQNLQLKPRGGRRGRRRP